MPPKPITENTLFYGDNLPILREYVPTESVDLVYLDPPFNSNRSYNVLFRDESGHDSESQLVAFDDTWHWGDAAEQTYHDLVNDAPAHVGGMIGALRQFIGANQMMAYLVMMAARLVELHRVLKPTGSLYLHCDPTASHYLKIMLDAVFGPKQFKNEIVLEAVRVPTATHDRAWPGTAGFETSFLFTRELRNTPGIRSIRPTMRNTLAQSTDMSVLTADGQRDRPHGSQTRRRHSV